MQGWSIDCQKISQKNPKNIAKKNRKRKHECKKKNHLSFRNSRGGVSVKNNSYLVYMRNISR